MEFITIESHFGVPNHYIRPNTRNKCSKNLVEIINQIAKVVYPDEDFEVYLMPSQKGSYKDVAKVINKNAGVIACLGLLFTGLTYYDSHQEYDHNKKARIIDDTSKCLALQEQLEYLSKDHIINGISTEKLKEICGDISIKKLKNERYQTLIQDDMVENEVTVVKNNSAAVVFQKKIERQDFGKYIESIPENEDYSKENVGGLIELVALVVKQKKEGRGITWQGVYYGIDIKENGVDILLNEEDVKFYMQDSDFKKRIDNHEITFASGDNIKVIFDIKGEIKNGVFQNQSIYVTKVESFNECIIEHTIKDKNNQFTTIHPQLGLFDEYKTN